MFTQRLVPQMQSRYTPLPPRIPNNRGVYKNSWRWHDAEQITRPLDNRTAVKQRSTENSPKTLQIQQHYKTIGERERKKNRAGLYMLTSLATQQWVPPLQYRRMLVLILLSVMHMHNHCLESFP